MSMKTWFLLSLTCLAFKAQATTYYISHSSGKDSNNGKSITSAWQSISKLNSNFRLLNPGDSILFKRGDTFYGNIIISQGGASGAPIVIGAYGNGSNPVVTGFTTVSTWTNTGTNIWESTSAVSGLPTCNMVVINGVNTPMGRYPNAGYLNFQSHVSNTSITSSSLNSAITDWTGAEVVIRKNRGVIDRNLISSVTGGTLNYTSGSKITPADGFGFFIQNDIRTLDRQNEWYYNPSTKKIRVYSAAAPIGVQVATLDTLLVAKSNMNYITIDNIDFTGSNTTGIQLYHANHFTIQRCRFNFSGRDAISTYACEDLTIQNCIINNSNNCSIYAGGYYKMGVFYGGKALISHNRINKTGVMAGMVSKNNSNTCYAIRAEGTNSIIEYNVIDSTGYIGVFFDGNSSIVRNNVIDYFCFVLDDGGGIYTWNNYTAPPKYEGRKVQNNIVSNGIGAGAGTDKPGQAYSDGIYMDDGTQAVEISGNTVLNCLRSRNFSS